ncbi:MAG: hypothetical protein ABEN55_13285, partial [Bradymonadaceae bacterium]
MTTRDDNSDGGDQPAPTTASTPDGPDEDEVPAPEWSISESLEGLDILVTYESDIEAARRLIEKC